jgi:TPR repeat protein
VLEKNINFINEKKSEVNFSKIIEELSIIIQDVESKLNSLALITFCRDKAEKYLSQVTEKLHNLNLVLISLFTKKIENSEKPKTYFVDQISNLNTKIDILENKVLSNLEKINDDKNKPSEVIRIEDEALFLEGIENYLGLKNRVDLKKSYECFNRASNFGNINSKIMLARMWEKGEYVENSNIKAIEYYKQASALGNLHANYMLGNYAENELFSEFKDGINYSETAIKYFLKSSEGENSAAIAKLGMIHEHGILSQMKDIKKAIDYYKKAIEIDENPEALNSLGNIYYKGDHLKQNLSLARECYQLAAKLGNADAMHNCGMCFEFGKGVDKNLDQAMIFYKRASEKYHPEGITNQAILLIKTNTENEKNLYKKAYGLLKLSTHLDRHNKDTLYYIGFLHENGYGTENDAYLAYLYYKKAMKLGHLKSRTKVALALLNGIEGKLVKDENTSISLFIEASELNEPEALNYLGLIYEKGAVNLPKSLDKSIECFKKSILLGYENASINLALLINSDSRQIDNSFISKNEDIHIDKIQQMSKRGNPIAKSVLEHILKSSKEKFSKIESKKNYEDI